MAKGAHPLRASAAGLRLVCWNLRRCGLRLNGFDAAGRFVPVVSPQCVRIDMLEKVPDGGAGASSADYEAVYPIRQLPALFFPVTAIASANSRCWNQPRYILQRQVGREPWR